MNNSYSWSFHGIFNEKKKCKLPGKSVSGKFTSVKMNHRKKSGCRRWTGEIRKTKISRLKLFVRRDAEFRYSIHIIKAFVFWNVAYVKIVKIGTFAIVTELVIHCYSQLVLRKFYVCGGIFFSNFLITEQEKKGIETYKSNVGDVRSKYSDCKHAAFVLLFFERAKIG